MLAGVSCEKYLGHLGKPFYKPFSTLESETASLYFHTIHTPSGGGGGSRGHHEILSHDWMFTLSEVEHELKAEAPHSFFAFNSGAFSFVKIIGRNIFSLFVRFMYFQIFLLLLDQANVGKREWRKRCCKWLRPGVEVATAVMRTVASACISSLSQFQQILTLPFCSVEHVSTVLLSRCWHKDGVTTGIC